MNILIRVNWSKAPQITIDLSSGKYVVLLLIEKGSLQCFPNC